MPKVAQAFLIGEAAEAFAKELDGKVRLTMSGDLARAVSAAHAAALADVESAPVVLLSPACASFDQFANFEARGARFRELVAALPGEHADLGPGGQVLS